jgi:hypothetical protein
MSTVHTGSTPWWARFTGGRPMKWEGFAFTDVVVNRDVHYYRDLFGRKWMCFGGCSLFRVRATDHRPDEEKSS